MATAGYMLTKSIEELVEAANLTTQLLRSHLTREHGHYYTASSQANASNQSSSQKGAKGMCVDSLDNGANDEDGRTQDQSPFATESMRDWPYGKTCEESAQLLEAD